ncbi:Excalibur domain protein [Pseudonocardia dioxanivorans CB1190]|uniref:Excalibur domain protein n=1 Tax=Pseudonocardia dioxanivorans (strain ATCC 55486 / DSM 44775 / JCM 13855 / CB1190) TaxID=675635 RepID=F4CWR7_PSEUX|nr:hypothetical protein [Pseudonocardia dioxanivorans]AEA23819.1 Excalibur domain protein [Pseudonocardia dioxanivorans CB1190]
MLPGNRTGRLTATTVLAVVAFPLTGAVLAGPAAADPAPTSTLAAVAAPATAPALAGTVAAPAAAPALAGTVAARAAASTLARTVAAPVAVAVLAPGAAPATVAARDLAARAPAQAPGCAEFPDQAAAQAALDSGAGDRALLDPDHDGRACEDHPYPAPVSVPPVAPSSSAQVPLIPLGAVPAGDGSAAAAADPSTSMTVTLDRAGGAAFVGGLAMVVVLAIVGIATVVASGRMLIAGVRGRTVTTTSPADHERRPPAAPIPAPRRGPDDTAEPTPDEVAPAPGQVAPTAHDEVVSGDGRQGDHRRAQRPEHAGERR